MRCFHIQHNFKCIEYSRKEYCQMSDAEHNPRDRLSSVVRNVVQQVACALAVTFYACNGQSRDLQ